jgi:hypothetical protein
MSGSITAFVQSWWVPSRICSVLGRPDGYSAATAIVTTGSNWVIGLLMGSGLVKSRSSTTSFCLVTSYDSVVMSYNTAWAGWLCSPYQCWTGGWFCYKLGFQDFEKFQNQTTSCSGISKISKIKEPWASRFLKNKFIFSFGFLKIFNERVVFRDSSMASLDR